MLDWQSRQIEFLKECIMNETICLYHYMKDKQDEIYAVSLIVDSDILTAYLAVSTYGSLKNKHKKKKWDSEEWLFTITDDSVKPCLDDFTQIIVKRYREEIIPKFKDGFKYTDEKKANLEMYIESLKQTKLDLTGKIDSSFNNVVFFINLPGEPKIIKKSAKSINGKSELLDELLKEI
ncbi:DUF4303 domain-containing protein [Acinetobacter sp. I-MWF]|uniref:DUF4303 domain-containing protein n=1 Tax=Acinetobacter sp. I-MWF TaxID=2940517 RepID=UPI0021C9B11E|nr:DUF4303 domain-containing protein [Acinetobacter sp. I-MWF]MCT9978684.1 DUF4303 domain-containing protein [Acinetobacter sp. I-MWF]